MNNAEMVNKAIELAIRGHNGQVNKHDGEPYLLHVHRVAASCNSLDPWQVSVAWMHDLLEDTHITVRDLEVAGFPVEIIQAVVALTKIKGQSNEDYYRVVRMDELAKGVKLHDIHDNFGRTYKIEDEATKARLAQKYSLGLDMLARGSQ